MKFDAPFKPIALHVQHLIHQNEDAVSKAFDYIHKHTLHPHLLMEAKINDDASICFYFKHTKTKVTTCLTIYKSQLH